VSQANSTVVLIDGKQIVDLMIRYGVGVTTVYTFAIKRIDQGYFAEE
jgi:restriction system protein